VFSLAIYIVQSLTSTGNITGDPDAEMAYAKYNLDIVDKYRIVLDGWPLKDFVSPSKIRTMKMLEKLAATLKGVDEEEPTCGFCKLTREEYEAHQAAQEAQATQGETVERIHKERSDKGVSRGPYKVQENEGEDAVSKRHEKRKRGKENDPSQKRRKAGNEAKSRVVITSNTDNA